MSAESIVRLFELPPKATVVLPKVIVLLTNLSLVIPPASWSLSIPLSFTEICPELILKSPESKLAIPLFDFVASSPSIVIVAPDAVVLIPSPAAIFNEESRRFTDPVPVSPEVLRVVLIDTSLMLSTKPDASTVRTGISVTEP